MIVGFNHNISYKGVGFHVQTEDSGVKSPQRVTLLYHGGTIIASKKKVYADILNVENLTQVVEDLAKEQHKGMLRSLTQGEFDQKILALKIPLEGVEPEVTSGPKSEPPVVPTAKPEPEPTSPAPQVAATDKEKLSPVATADQSHSAPDFMAEPLLDKLRHSKPKVRREPTLDDLIYAYLTGADKC